MIDDIELWGGVECTVNRVGDGYFDQIERTGHGARLEDLAQFAELGLKVLRYPVLWERTAPDGLDKARWAWADERLGRMRALGIRPIVGLVHHGSGPRWTSLLDSAFPAGLAAYARAVAERYPWLEDYTPVNEPLTTARFSALYGHWYPHARSDKAFACAMVTQCRAVVEAMAAIRAVNPRARLVQTEDIGKTFSTPRLAYQAAYENQRRFLSLDLLCGRVTPDHELWHYLLSNEIRQEELEWFLEHPCPPQIVGLNYYLTSERFLDERIERYPPSTHGGNWELAYADVETVRVREAGLAGPGQLFREVWARYGLPIAVTEVHNGCTREEQMRWLAEVWAVARALRAEGVDMRAVTAWSLLGAYDWHTLVTRTEGVYEPGVFDLRAPAPRPTGLARLVRQLAHGREPAHPVLQSPGWWHRPERLIFGFAAQEAPQQREALTETASLELAAGGRAAWLSPPVQSAAASRPRRARDPGGAEPGPRLGVAEWGGAAQPLLITGAAGTLGAAFARACAPRGLAHVALFRRELDIADRRAVADAVARYRPWAIVNAAGYVRVDEAEEDQERCWRENCIGAAVLAEACACQGIQLLTFSTDLVFDGAQSRPYVERDAPRPRNVYGQSKLEAEQCVLEALPDALVVRTSAFFSPWDSANFVTQALNELAAGRPVLAADDLIVSPTYVPDLVQACLDLLIDGERGIWHLANPGAISWADLARAAAAQAGLDASGVEAVPADRLGLRAPRPRYSVLGSARGTLLPKLEDALRRYLEAVDLPRAACLCE